MTMRAKKVLGQNFLNNPMILERIVGEMDLKEDDVVVEVGPGKGSLTRLILSRVKKLIAVEKDERLADWLSSELVKWEGEVQNTNDEIRMTKYKRRSTRNEVQKTNSKGQGKKEDEEIFELRTGDILKYQPPQTSYKLVGNIPYYLTSPLLRKFLGQEKNKPALIVFLVQKEVAQKICADPGEMSLLSLGVQAWGKPKFCFEVKRHFFNPVPKVDSAVVKIQIYSDCVWQKPKEVLRLAQICFSQKRKKLRNSLRALLKDGKIDFNLEQRPQELKVEEWEELYEKIAF